MFATVTVAVCHCGAGCLLGDIVGEWLVYGTDATINGRHLWVSYLVGMLYFFESLCASLKVFQRLWFRALVWNLLPVLVNSSDVRKIRPRNYLARFESRLFVFNLFSDRTLRMDGHIPNSHLGLQPAIK